MCTWCATCNKGVWKKMEMNGGDIPIEICPTSNVMTLGLQGLNEHPTLKKLIDEGYPISVNTDDKGVFNTQQSDELYMIAKEVRTGKNRSISVREAI